jgi:hypothetical protein
MWQNAPRPKKDPKSLFHGTPDELNPGDIILPASKVDKHASADPEKAYATESPYVAKFMAWEQNNHRGENFREDTDENPPVENVYHVEPVTPNEMLGFRSGIIMDHTAEPVHRDSRGRVVPAPEPVDPHTVDVEKYLNEGRLRTSQARGEGNEYTSTSGYRVLSKMFDPKRTIELKSRLRRIEEAKESLDQSIVSERIFGESRRAQKAKEAQED